MIKNIYDKVNNYYKHEYFCDCCFVEIEYGEILRSEEAIKENDYYVAFVNGEDDLDKICEKCWRK